MIPLEERKRQFSVCVRHWYYQRATGEYPERTLADIGRSEFDLNIEEIEKERHAFRSQKRNRMVIGYDSKILNRQKQTEANRRVA